MEWNRDFSFLSAVFNIFKLYIFKTGREQWYLVDEKHG